MSIQILYPLFWWISNCILFNFKFLIYFVIKVLKNCCTMLCQFPLYTKVTQSLLMYIHIHSFSCIFFYHCLSQETDYSSLCYRVGPHCLSILNLYSFFNQLTCLFSIEFLTYWIQFPFRHMIGKYFFFPFWKYALLLMAVSLSMFYIYHSSCLALRLYSFFFFFLLQPHRIS